MKAVSRSVCVSDMKDGKTFDFIFVKTEFNQIQHNVIIANSSCYFGMIF